MIAQELSGQWYRKRLVPLRQTVNTSSLASVVIAEARQRNRPTLHVSPGFWHLPALKSRRASGLALLHDIPLTSYLVGNGIVVSAPHDFQLAAGAAVGITSARRTRSGMKSNEGERIIGPYRTHRAGRQPRENPRPHVRDRSVFLSSLA